MDQRSPATVENTAQDQTATDPVCGMKVSVSLSAHQHEYAGQKFYFCSEHCRTRFIAEPAAYLKSAEPSSGPGEKEGVIYTCPMHPQIRQTHPGYLPDLRHDAGAGRSQPKTVDRTPNSQI